MKSCNLPDTNSKREREDVIGAGPGRKAEFEAVIRKQKEVRDLEEKLENERKELLRKHAVELKNRLLKSNSQSRSKRRYAKSITNNFSRPSKGRRPCWSA